MEGRSEIDATIITPVWNRADMTLQYLTHHRRLYQHSPVEIIIINNGSTDATSSILKTWEKDNIHVITNKENRGFGAANNQGAKAAIGDVLIFLNNDVLVHGDYISIITKTLEKFPDDLCGAEYHDKDTGWNVFANSVMVPYLAGWCLAMRVETFKDLGGFDERYSPGDYEDVDLCYNAILNGRFLHPLTLPLTHLSNQTAKQLPDRRKMTEKHRRLFAKKWNLPL